MFNKPTMTGVRIYILKIHEYRYIYITQSSFDCHRKHIFYINMQFDAFSISPKENLQAIRSCKSSDFSNPYCSHPTKNQQNWARKWANHRAQQAILMKDVHSTKEDSNKLQNCKIVRQDEKVLTTKRSPLSLNVHLPNVQFNEKSADVFSRLRSIYSNENERNRRLRNIHERMNELQKKSIKKQVDLSIREFRRRSEEDKSNRKELKRVREKFLETKKTRQSQMHVSQSALDAPAVSRQAYGLPLEGKEFTVSLSSKKTTAEMKNLWRMALLRKQCIDSFMSNISLMHRPLDALTLPQSESSLQRNDRLRSDSEDYTIHRLNKYNSLEKGKGDIFLVVERMITISN